MADQDHKRVEVLSSIITGSVEHGAGSILDLPAQIAKDLIEAGRAKDADGAEPVQLRDQTQAAAIAAALEQQDQAEQPAEDAPPPADTAEPMPRAVPRGLPDGFVPAAPTPPPAD